MGDNSKTPKVGTLVRAKASTVGLPGDLNPKHTIHEGNSWMIAKGDIGMIVDFSGKNVYVVLINETIMTVLAEDFVIIRESTS